MGQILHNILLGISLAAPLGPAGVAVLRAGLRYGFQRAFLTGLGITAADATYLLVVFFGLAGFIVVPVVKIAVWAFGAVVLLFLGVQSVRTTGRMGEIEAVSASADRHPLAAGYLINISNPLAVVWWLGVFGSLLGTSAGRTSRPAALLSSAAILIGILAWHTTMAVLTNWGKRFINPRSARWVSILAGVALVLFGLRFGYAAVTGLASL